MILKLSTNNYIAADKASDAEEIFLDHNEGALAAIKEFAEANGYDKKEDLKESPTTISRIYYNKRTPEYSSSLFLRELEGIVNVVINCSRNKALPSIAKCIKVNEFTTEKLQKLYTDLCK